MAWIVGADTTCRVLVQRAVGNQAYGFGDGRNVELAPLTAFRGRRRVIFPIFAPEIAAAMPFRLILAMPMHELGRARAYQTPRPSPARYGTLSIEYTLPEMTK